MVRPRRHVILEPVEEHCEAPHAGELGAESDSTDNPRGNDSETGDDDHDDEPLANIVKPAEPESENKDEQTTTSKSGDQQAHVKMLVKEAGKREQAKLAKEDQVGPKGEAAEVKPPPSKRPRASELTGPSDKQPKMLKPPTAVKAPQPSAKAPTGIPASWTEFQANSDPPRPPPIKPVAASEPGTSANRCSPTESQEPPGEDPGSPDGIPGGLWDF